MQELASISNQTLLEPVGPRLLANALQLSITTDSVVATATVTPSGAMKNLFIAWGDGATSSLSSRPGIPTPPVFGEQDNPLPAGTYRLSHAYAEPEDRRTFEYYILVRARDWDGGEELNFVKVALTPRYRVINYRTRVWLTGPCDSAFESTSEFDISQVVDGHERHRWHWEPSNNFFSESQAFVLEDSQLSRELTMDDPGVDVHFVFTETDPIQDDVLTFYAPLSAFQQTETVRTQVGDTGGIIFGSCGFIATYDREVSLIVPLPSSGQEVVFENA